MKLVDQWSAIEDGLPVTWEDVRLTLTTEQQVDLPRAAQVLGSINAGKVGSALVFHVLRAGGAQGPRRRSGSSPGSTGTGSGAISNSRTSWFRPTLDEDPAEARTDSLGVAASWDVALSPLPSDWTDLLCELEIVSSTLLDRTALLCAPLNPSRDGSRLAFTFRCSGRSGFGASRSMARRCFERLDDDGITGVTRVLRVLSDTDNVGTQGPVWLVGGKTL